MPVSMKEKLDATAALRAKVDGATAVMSALGRAAEALKEAQSKSADEDQKLRFAALLSLLRNEWKLAAQARKEVVQ